jgi:hypothetical protein
LLKAVQLLGFPEAEDESAPCGALHGHVPYPHDFPPGTQHLCIFRHPRNCLISMCRFKRMPLTTGYLIGYVRKYDDSNRPMATVAREFTPWLTRNSLAIRYENLTASDATLRAIATYLNVPYLEDAFPHLPGLTRTWSGNPSRWEDHWNAELDRVWHDSGMQEVQSAWNY